MSTTETTATDKEKYVDLFVPKGYANDEPNLLISINGKNFLLPKGKASRVPLYVKEELERSQKAQAIFDARSEELLEKANKPIH